MTVGEKVICTRTVDRPDRVYFHAGDVGVVAAVAHDGYLVKFPFGTRWVEFDDCTSAKSHYIKQFKELYARQTT